MRAFYKQVAIGGKRFVSECALCREKVPGPGLPPLCRRPGLAPALEAGSLGGLRQRLYNRALVRAVQELSCRYNFCPGCGRWVCDRCFDTGTGKCKKCHQNKEE